MTPIGGSPHESLQGQLLESDDPGHSDRKHKHFGAKPASRKTMSSRRMRDEVPRVRGKTGKTTLRLDSDGNYIITTGWK